MMLHTKYQVSRPCGFRKDFFMSLCKICDPGPGHFWPQGHNLNKLSGGSLDDATYQISRL